MKKIFYYLTFIFFISFNANTIEINKIDINGNNRISNETILLFGEIENNKNYNDEDLNRIIKNLYKTNFFENISINIQNNILKINVIENPIVQTIEILGVKNKKIIKLLNDNLKLKEKSSFIENKAKRDELMIKNILKVNGYYFSNIQTFIIKNDNNTVDINYDIKLGEKAHISKIKFIGDKVVKDRKLKSIIISEESKFWKFISNKKYLDKKRIELDEKLLRNYYRNNGFFNVQVNSTSAQLIDGKEFELIYNINAGNIYKFNKLRIDVPASFDEKNFLDIQKVLDKLVGKNYSLNKIEKILDEIDKIALSKQFQFIEATYLEESEGDDKINLTIKITEGEKLFVEKINIYGNYITNENVIRNALITDEGDAFNEILFKKSINQIKSKNIFSKVKTDVKDGFAEKSKVIDITVEEKPTGEISAGAGTGTTGSSISFGIRENNYLGKGQKLDSNFTISDDTFTGLFSITDPNFNNSDKSLITTVETSRNDLMSKFGYETTETGFSLGTSFEQYQDIFFSPSISTYYESLTTSNLASAAKKKQEGDYLDTNFSYNLSLNKLNQNFQPSSGYKSSFFQSIPIVADDDSFVNSYEYSLYSKLENETVLSFIFFAKAINSLDGDVRVSKRVFIPSRKLRGFKSGKIGPKDAGDYIGGNYGTTLNVAATLPKLFVDLQNIDFSIFVDSANLFGVDYDSSLDKSKIRSSTGIAVDWFTPIGPLSFSLAAPLTKASTDETESFRFKIGTTF